MRLASAQIELQRRVGGLVDEADGRWSQVDDHRRAGGAGLIIGRRNHVGDVSNIEELPRLGAGDQLEVIHEVFCCTPEEESWARGVLSAWKEQRGEQRGVVVLDGEMIDKPHLVQARRIIALAGRLKTRPGG